MKFAKNADIDFAFFNNRNLILKCSIMNNAPILITAYNRYTNFKKLLRFTNFYKAKIYISIDGPRNDFDKDQQNKMVNLIEKLKKNYNVKYRILDKNLGCQGATFSSLDWFFDQEKKGIILEDDNLPSVSFFEFCNESLTKYSKEKNIFSISGYNPFKKIDINSDYFFSNYFMSWGWATWRSRWLIVKKFTPQNKWKKLLKSKEWSFFLDNNIKKRYFNKIYNLIKSNKIDSWAFLWMLIGVSNGSKFIIPKHNLIKNTGTQTHGANYTPSNFEYSNFKTVQFKIKHHPKKNSHNKKLDTLLFYHNYRPKNHLYPWRIIFILKSLLFDTKFFFTKLVIFIKKY